MADIKDQLIKDSYNYVLQCNFGDGIVYRIGGAIPVNPVFQSGLTVNDSFTYSNGTEQLGYVLTCDALGNAIWAPVSAATPSSGVTSITVGEGLSANSSTGAVTIVFTGSTGISGEYLPLSGGTVSGFTTFNSGVDINSLTASSIYLGYLFSNGQTDLNTLQVVSTSIFNDDVTIYADLNVSQTISTDTISATTYLNYPDSYVTGFSLSSNTITLSQNRTDQYSAFTINLSANTGGGLNYYVLPSAPTGVTLNNGDRWFDTTTGAEVVYINDGDSRQWIQPNNAAQSSSPVSYYTASTYSSMIAFGTPANMTIIKVLNDENKSVSNAIYQVWPDGVRMWMAAIQDN
jgi:hypothetical protein